MEELELDNYLLGVVSAEMPANFEMEALKAQAIVARTYTLYKITEEKKHENVDICDDPTCCQAWISKEDRLNKWNEEEKNSNWEKILKAVNSTKGKIVTYEGKPINAFFHSNSGGTTDTASNVWGGQNYPYLQVVATSGEDNYTQYSSEIILAKEEFISKIKEYHSNFEIDFNQENQIQILEYTDGERIKTIKIGNIDLSGVEVRTIFGLKSAKFEIIIDGDNIKFNVIRIWTRSWNESNRC
ncbi:MAG: stage II sporulation protein D [Clostridia bacterium]|nr:stage II sporulation protein D [Clostridia bacterium]